MNEQSRTILYYPIPIVKDCSASFCKVLFQKTSRLLYNRKKSEGWVKLSQTALLVVDIQTGTLAPLIGKERLVENVNALIDHFQKEYLPIVFIKKVGYGELSQKLHRDVNDRQSRKHR